MFNFSRCDNCKQCYHYQCLDPPIKVSQILIPLGAHLRQANFYLLFLLKKCDFTSADAVFNSGQILSKLAKLQKRHSPASKMLTSVWSKHQSGKIDSISQRLKIDVQNRCSCGPGSLLGPGVICGLSLLLVLVLAPWVFLRVLRFSSLHKEPTIPNSNSICLQSAFEYIHIENALYKF